MRLAKWTVVSAMCGLLVVSGSALVLADTSVELKGVHLCCGACVKGVATALKDVEGVSAKCDRAARKVTITAKDDPAAQKALDALAAAGYHGDTGNKALTIKETSTAPAGKVKKLKISGVHNCCTSCNTAIKEAVKTVEGVSGDTAKSRTESFEVTGDFDAAALLKALNDAGFHGKIAD